MPLPQRVYRLTSELQAHTRGRPEPRAIRASGGEALLEKQELWVRGVIFGKSLVKISGPHIQQKQLKANDFLSSMVYLFQKFIPQYSVFLNYCAFMSVESLIFILGIIAVITALTLNSTTIVCSHEAAN